MSLLKSDLFTDKKPMSMTVKDYLIRRMAPKMMLSEKVLDAVITHQFSSAHEALSNSKSVEISGFGKFFFNEKKAHKLLEKFESQKELFEKRVVNQELPEAKRRSAELQLQMAINGITDLKPRIHETSFSDLRGVEEQSASPEGAEEAHQGDEQTEAGDMPAM